MRDWISVFRELRKCQFHLPLKFGVRAAPLTRPHPARQHLRWWMREGVLDRGYGEVPSALRGGLTIKGAVY